jgi:hypothetical protein
MTNRNAIVKNHYKNLGFSKISTDDQAEIWNLDIENYKFQKVPIKSECEI